MSLNHLPSFSAMSGVLSSLPFADGGADRAVFLHTFGSHRLRPQDLPTDRRQAVPLDTAFTGSVDAALLALDCLIPDAVWKLGNDGGPNAEVQDPATGRSYTSVGATPALALLSAAFHVAAGMTAPETGS